MFEDHFASWNTLITCLRQQTRHQTPPTTSANHTEVTCPMTASRELSGSNDQEMAEQQTQPGLSQEEQEAHDLETKGYCITNWKQLCSTAEAAKAKRKAYKAAKAKRKAYKAERQQKAKQRNAFHKRNDNDKDRIIQAKSFEIQDLCARLNGINQKHQLEIERITKFRDTEIRNLRELVRDKNELIEEYGCVDKAVIKIEHTAELESRDQMQAMLLVDLRELCQVYDEEVEVMKETIDRQGKCAPVPTSLISGLLTLLFQLFLPTTPPSTSKAP
jgi:hypothetical protein